MQQCSKNYVSLCPYLYSKFILVTQGCYQWCFPLHFRTVIGVELFFNVPRHRHPTLYTYHTMKVAANYHIVADATQTIQQILCDADFMGQMMLFLNKGWKLIDICMDTTALAEGKDLPSLPVHLHQQQQ